jgi:cellulose synthase/poly-beta-1,6-N-acetylglucosamine synthase-like glycosyltransferase
MPAQELPSVSVIMPVIDEERHLPQSISRILEQDYAGELEIIVAVGPSRDRTADVAAEISAREDRVQVVANPSGKTPAGLNAAIEAASGEIVVRVDGHAMVPINYVSVAVSTLETSGADNVGGIMNAEGTTDFEDAVARAMTSRFGVGGAAFHVGGVAGPALSVYLGCFRRAALDRVGGYDVTMERAQDWEMNLRIRQTGGIVWFTPDLKVTYRPRPTLKALARQYHDYGRWRREVATRHPETVSLRYLAAPVAVIGVILGISLGVVGLLVGLPWLAVLGFAAPAGYLVLDLIASAVAALTRPHLTPGAALRLPLVYAAMHATWGWGFLRGGVRSS